MKKSTYNDIQSLFKSGEVQTIKFSKTGKVSVKFTKEPCIVQYVPTENIMQTILEDVEMYKSLEKTVNKPKLKLTVNEFVKIHTLDQELKKPSLFERISIALWGEKSFAWGELKGL